MKTSIIAIFTTLLIMATTALGDGVQYFVSPKESSVFHPGSRIRFSVDDIPDHHGHRMRANLYREPSDGMPLQTLQIWEPSSLEGDDKQFTFEWTPTEQVRRGRYYVQLEVEDEDSTDRVRSRTFAVSPDNVAFDSVV